MLRAFIAAIPGLHSVVAGHGAEELATAVKPPLTVRVQDPEGSAIAGARVSLAGFGLEQSTDANGEAVFRQVGAGRFRVAASAEGFYANESWQAGLAPGERAALPVTLVRRAVVSESIVVTGTGTAALAREAPVRTGLITPDLINRQVRTTLAEAFQAPSRECAWK